jgi:Lrp/AsnC family leucine-responsive transcriptional regulator
MDTIDRKIIELLASDSRRSLADIGAGVDLAPSSVNDRIRRLTASGAVRRFTIDADPEAIGLGTLVFVWVALREDADEGAFRRHAAAHPRILECHHVTGPWSYLVKVRVAAPSEIEDFLAGLKAQGFLGRSETIIALSSPVPGAFVPKVPA